VRPPLGYDLMMRGRFRDYPAGFGTDLLIRELGRYGFRATFFVEVLCAEYFGVGGLADVCNDLIQSGQDIQLHLHPNFRRPEWRHAEMQPLPDNIGVYSLAEQQALLIQGIALLAQAGVPPSSIVGFRAGNYGASNHTWEAVRNAGLLIDSSLNLSYLRKDCLLLPDRPRVDLYQPIPGLWELPISCVSEGKSYRPLEVTAILAAEMKLGLELLREAGARAATIVTHPGEFFVVDDHKRRQGRPNRINIRRFRSLLTFLDDARDRFKVKTISDLAISLREHEPVMACEPVTPPRGSRLLRLGRMPVQAVKRIMTQPKQRN
jgi:hypothetical protein